MAGYPRRFSERHRPRFHPSWIDSLTQLAGRLATGEAAIRGAVAAAPARLAETLVRSLVAGQIRNFATVAALLVAAGLVAPHLVPAGPAKAGPGGPIQTTHTVDSSPEAPASGPPQAAVTNDPERLLTVHGRVLDPDGKPLVGAKVYSYRPLGPRDDFFFEGPPVLAATSGAGGEFQYQVADPRLQALEVRETWKNPIVVALAHGFGPAWATITRINDAKDLTLRLVRDDVPIVGRVLDLEGRAVSGATIRPVLVSAYPNEDLSAWESAMAKAKDINSNEAMRLQSRSLELFRWRDQLAVSTDAEGRFRLAGLGRERVVSLWIEGPTIATSFGGTSTRTRPGPTYRLAMQRDKPEFGTLVFHGATVDHVAAPTRPIEGTVRDKDTGKPLAGVSIRGREYARTTTGADGRYRLVGLPVGPGNVITAIPGRGQPYLGAGAEAPAGIAPDSAAVDFALKHGVAIRGKLTEKATGKPVPGVVEYFLFGDNPHRAEVGRLPGGEVRTGPDGSFELVALPDRGLVAARAAKDHYLPGQGAATIRGADERGWFHTDPHLCQPEFFHAIIAIEPAEGADSITCNLALDPGNSRAGTVLDPDGKPLAGCVAVNLYPATMSQHIDTLASEAFTAMALEPKHGRHLFFRHHEKKLAAVVMAAGGGKEPISVRLQPAGAHRPPGGRRGPAPDRHRHQCRVWPWAVHGHPLLFHACWNPPSATTGDSGSKG